MNETSLKSMLHKPLFPCCARSNPKTNFIFGILLLDKNAPEAESHLRKALNAVSRAHLALAVFYARLEKRKSAQDEVDSYIQSAQPAVPADVERFVAYASPLPAPATAFGFSSSFHPLVSFVEQIMAPGCITAMARPKPATSKFSKGETGNLTGVIAQM